MADFDKAFAYLTPLEGGYSDDPADRGGATRYGISLRFYRENVDKYAGEEDIQNLTRGEARDLYYLYFWEPLSLDQLDSQPVANRVFALAVHAGLRPAVRVLQRALNHSGWKLEKDGVLGPKTLNAANATADNPLVQDLRLETYEFYQEILSRRTQLERFRRGWARRAML